MKTKTKKKTVLAHYRATMKRARETIDMLDKELDIALKANEVLYERLCLALDGGRLPKGLLSSAEALEPFAVAASELRRAAGTNLNFPVTLLLPTGSGGYIYVERFLTVSNFRDAERTLAWIKEHRRKP